MTITRRKMKKIILFSAIIISSAVQGYSSAPDAPFRKVELTTTGSVFITQGDSNSVVVNTDASEKSISTKVVNGTLIISSAVKAEYHITMKQLDGVSVSGNGEVTCTPSIVSDELHLEVGGNGI